MNLIGKLVVAMLVAASSVSAVAEVSSQEAKQLGETMTPWGAEKAGNKEGTIPAYTGGLDKAPASYNPARKGALTDPYADEKPLFSIDANNVGKYADKLSDGVKAALAKYPNARVDVYPTHRSAVYPKRIADNSIKNATTCKEVGMAIDGCVGGVPFPIPKTGTQVVWNHILGWAGEHFNLRVATVLTSAGGKPIVQGVNDAYFEYPYFSPKNDGHNVKYYQRSRYDFQEPAKVSGEKILLHYPINNGPTLVWQYLPGQRRTKLSPDLAYDTPHPQSGGTATMDQLYGFYGPTDRFDFQIVGKKEMFIPYNNFHIYTENCSLDKIFQKNFPNPSCVRWELHRVWVVQATLKQGKRHIFSKRTMYIDEDTYNTGVYDGYDMAGKIYRFELQMGHPSYHDPEVGFNFLTTMHFDLQTGAYLTDNYPSPYPPVKGYAAINSKLPDGELQPEALAGGGIR